MTTTVPNLATPITEPLFALEEELLSKQVQIECWFRQQWEAIRSPVYSSVDVRNSGFKVAPVDTNLFSAGFNNINAELKPLCIQAVQSTLKAYCPGAEKILLIPESHTRNLFYLENLATLVDFISSAGYEVRVGSLLDEITQPTTFETAEKREITLYPIERKNDVLESDGFVADFILLNNDLSGGYPKILENLQQPIAPDLRHGWEHRLKSEHFFQYKKVAEQFSEMMGIDPWLINPYYRNCGEVDFMAGEGIDCLQYNAEVLFRSIEKKYAQYNISEKPFIIVKADAGSYGMGIMSITSAEELVQLNRKQRTHMAKTKGKVSVSKVILQEGVHTFETWDDEVAEPVVYMIGDYVVGGFYRLNTKRGSTENLNSPGMHFQSLAFADSCQAPGKSACEASQRRFYIYGVIARLAALAAAKELSA